MHAASLEDAPVIRLTSDRDMEPETGADPTAPAAMLLTPWAINSRGADHGTLLSDSKPDAIPTIERKLIAEKIAAVMNPAGSKKDEDVAP